MKILFTSVGRRVELIQAFKNASLSRDIDLTIYGSDIDLTAPALYFCDKQIISPRISEDSYIPFLIDLCKKEEIDALIPTIDTDLLVLSKNKDRFGKTKVIVSDFENIKKCRDKRLTSSLFKSCGLKTPETVDDILNYKGSFPAFIKPKDGSSSIFAYKINNLEELNSFSLRVPEYIVQEYIEGTEYTVDILCDFEGNPIYITPRIRLSVRDGEVLKTRIDLDEEIIEESKRIIKEFKPCGQITVQLIRKKGTSEDYFIEINPRFGGGSPLSFMAGANSADVLLRLLNGEKVEYIDKAAENGAIYSRYDQSIRIK